MRQPSVYEQKSRNPFAATVRLTPVELKVGWWRTTVRELHLVAMADAYRRGRWLGGGGTERSLARIKAGRDVVPLTRVSGSAQAVRVRRAAEFAEALGEFAVQHSGGAREVELLAARARDEGVPLWIARRHAATPAGPVTVAVDRRSVRADVWADGALPVRIRAPHGVRLDRRVADRGLRLTIGDTRADLTVEHEYWRPGKSHVTVAIPGRRWELRRRSERSSELTCDGQPVAVLHRPDMRGMVPVLLPLADVQFASPGALDPLDAVVAHTFAVACGLGDGTGTVRFGGGLGLPGTDHPYTWQMDWHTGVGSSLADSGPGAGWDGWGGGDGGGGGDGSGGGDGGGGSDGGGGGGGDGGGGG